MITIHNRDIKQYFNQMTDKIKFTDLYGYDLFIEVIKKSGEAISGRVYMFHGSYFGIRKTIYSLSDPSAKNRNEHYMFCEDLDRMTILDRSYLPKLVHDWIYRKDIEDVWLVHITKKIEYKHMSDKGVDDVELLFGVPQEHEAESEIEESNILSGVLISAHQEFIGAGYLNPIAFSILINSDENITKSFCISDFQTSRSIQLIYCSRSYDEDRNCIVSDFFQSYLIKDLGSLVCQYIHGDIPGIVSEKWKDFFMKLNTKTVLEANDRKGKKIKVETED